MTDVRPPRSDHFVYVLRCADGSLYTGYTTDPERRVREHDAGDGAKYTRGRTPVELVHAEEFESKSTAMSREYAIKQRTRPAKERLLAEGGVPESVELPESLLADDAR